MGILSNTKLSTDELKVAYRAILRGVLPKCTPDWRGNHLSYMNEGPVGVQRFGEYTIEVELLNSSSGARALSRIYEDGDYYGFEPVVLSHRDLRNPKACAKKIRKAVSCGIDDLVKGYRRVGDAFKG